MKFDDFAEQRSLFSPFCLSPASVQEKKKSYKVWGDFLKEEEKCHGMDMT